jgi:uncharacterized cupin superfamily protein
MIRCVRLWTGDDGNSYFEEGSIEVGLGKHGDFVSRKLGSKSISFQETPAFGSLDWHAAPTRQFVITLSGTLLFTIRGGQQFTLHPGDILLAEDTAGTGHSWRLIDNQPWRRVYVALDTEDTPVFRPDR